MASAAAERPGIGPRTFDATQPGLGTVQARPELLAPAGDRTCLIAAVENGADAVYFGLARHNARMRADNFDGAELPEIMGLVHRRGVRGYVTLNTLVFTDELPGLEAAVREIAAAGVDAVIVQDIGLTRVIRAIAPDLEIHGSTQMSVTSRDGVELARELGCSRVILARELSLAEIGRIRRETELPVEVFVHGALCVAYSGQCLTSEALGGRSANRGECAQACRMPYQIVCDGRIVDLDDVRYLLSPQDLAAYDLVPRLIELGVASLKIEGRLKSPEYVANITRHYRAAIDAAMSRQAGRVHAAGRPRDGALVLPRVLARLPRRQQPQGPRAGRLRQEAGDRPGRRRVRDGGRRPDPRDRAGQAGGWPGVRRRRGGWSRRAGRPSLRGDPAGRQPSRGPRGAVRTRGRLRRAGRAAVRPRRDRPPCDRPRRSRVEDRRPRADRPPAPVVRGPAGSQGRAGPPHHRDHRRARPDRGADIDRPRRVGRRLRPAGPGRRPACRRGPVRAPSSAGSAARSTGCETSRRRSAASPWCR